MMFRRVPQLSGNGCEDNAQRRGSQDESRDSGHGVRSRSAFEKRSRQSFWKGIAAFGVRRFGEKKPIEF
jgi:hypothetical protein